MEFRKFWKKFKNTFFVFVVPIFFLICAFGSIILGISFNGDSNVIQNETVICFLLAGSLMWNTYNLVMNHKDPDRSNDKSRFMHIKQSSKYDMAEELINLGLFFNFDKSINNRKRNNFRRKLIEYLSEDYVEREDD